MRHALSLLLTGLLLAGPEPHPAVAQAPKAAGPIAPATPLTLRDLVGVWAYDFAHIAQRDDIAQLAASGRLQHILDFQGKATIEITDDGTLAVRIAGTQAFRPEPTSDEHGRLLTNIESAAGPVPLTLRRLDENTLLAGYAEFPEHEAFRFVRLTAPGTNLLGRWSGEGENERVRLLIRPEGTILLVGAGDRLAGRADITTNGLEHTLTLDDGTEIRATLNENLASISLRVADADPITLARTYDPMAWIEGSWLVDAVSTSRHPFYQIWPAAFGAPPPSLEPTMSLFVKGGKHSGQLQMDVHSANGDTVIFGVGTGTERTLLPFLRLTEDHAETLVLKLMLRRAGAPEYHALQEEQDAHNHQH